MSQSATKLVKDALERKVAQAEAESRKPTTLTRSELAAAVRDGVREGIADYERDAGRRAGLRGSDDRESRSGDPSTDESSSNGGGGLGALFVLALVVAGVLYRRRRRSRYDEPSSGF